MEYKKIPINIKEKILKEYIAYRTCIICNKKNKTNKQYL